MQRSYRNLLNTFLWVLCFSIEPGIAADSLPDAAATDPSVRNSGPPHTPVRTVSERLHGVKSMTHTAGWST